MFKTSLAILVLAGGAVIASAAPVTYDVNGTFSDGTTFTGNFVLDAAANTLVSSDITTLADGANYLGAEYTNSGVGDPWIQPGGVDAPGDFTLYFTSASFNQYMFFWFAGAPADFTGGAIETYPSTCSPGECVFSGENDFSNGFNRRTVVSGTVEQAEAPEPNTALLLAGLAGLVALNRKRLARA